MPTHPGNFRPDSGADEAPAQALSPRLRGLSEALGRAQKAALFAECAPLSRVFDEAALARRMGLNASLFFLREHWPHIAGVELARHSTPQSLKAGVLTVQTDTPLHRQELTYALNRIMRIAQDHLGPDRVQSVKAARP